MCIRDRLRSEFVANVTHELKTPLTAIRGSIELLKSADRDEETRRYFYDVLDIEAERLHHLIDDMLVLSQIEMCIRDRDKAITTLGREAASGTRDGFESIFSIESPVYAAELSSTGEIVTKISSDISAIGYVSLESLNDSVVACKVDGVEATEENIENGSYTVQRPFIQIYKKGTDSALIDAWFEFIESSEGQQIIKDVGLIGTANKNG